MVDSRWPIFAEENGLTRIAGMAHRLDMLATLDLRPILPEITADLLLIQGDQDRIVPRRHHDVLHAGMPHATSMVLPHTGHQPHYTHPETLTDAISEFLDPSEKRHG